MSSLIIRLHLIIIQVKCRQTTVEFSIHFNHVSEQGLTGSRLDAHQIFPNVLITTVKEFNVIITNMLGLGGTSTFLLSVLSTLRSKILSREKQTKGRQKSESCQDRSRGKDYTTQDVIRMKTSVTWRQKEGFHRQLGEETTRFYSEVTAPALNISSLQVHHHISDRSASQQF